MKTEKLDKAKSEHDQMDLWVYYERKKEKQRAHTTVGMRTTQFSDQEWQTQIV